ncbi:VWD domain-containing protein, partial [Salmonella enterica subsp. enterica serovar 1,4,[5],12:i:-]|nr:VWD domain-containing protein [Salmonella enterica subsp. enterica serovar 1,4,[5],12:i:-]
GQCMVDQGQITTFDNRTYQLGEKGNVLVQSYYSAARNWRQEQAPQGYHNFTIAIQRESGQQEVVIAVEENILRIKPNSGRSAIFQFNDKNVAVSQGERVPLRDNRGTEVMEVMQTADVHYTVRSREVGFQLIWAGNSVMIQLDGSLRGKVR